MPILYSVIANKQSILARYASCAGNFSEVTEQVLARITPDTPRLTYSHGSYLFHYVYEDGIVYMCISDDDFDRSRAFRFLAEIKKRFQTMYGNRALTALPYSLNTEFSRVLATQMKHFSESRDVDIVSQVQGELDDLKAIMVQNLDSAANRGEQLHLLVDKADLLSSNSIEFRKSSRNLARAMFWKNIKITIIIIIVVIVILYIIVSAACGGLAWPSCV